MAKAKPLSLLSVFLCLAYVSLFSGDHVARKLLVQSFTSFGLNALLFLVAGTIFIIIGRSKKLQLIPDTKKGVFLLFLNGLYASAMVIFLQLGLSNSSAGLANAVFCAYPMITYLTSVIFLKEDSLSLSKFLGFGIVFTGFYILISSIGQNQAVSFPIIIATFMIGSQLCLVRKLTPRYGIVPTITWQHVVTGLVCMTLSIFWGFLKSPFSVELIYSSLLPFIYLAVAVNVFAYLIQAYLLKMHLASSVSAFILLRPLMGFVIAAVFLSEVINVQILISAIITGIGVAWIFKGEESLRFIVDHYKKNRLYPITQQKKSKRNV